MMNVWRCMDADLMINECMGVYGSVWECMGVEGVEGVDGENGMDRVLRV